MTKRVIAPLFIPHQGCPHRCVFCDQRLISGGSARLPDAALIVATVEEWRRHARGNPVEVAFYGGSFTALPRGLQEELLSPLQPLLRSGAVSSVRLSTRPDGIDAETARFLGDAGVATVELGVQSMDDSVLARAGRGHTAAQTAAAFALLKGAGFRVGAQLMPGLPGEEPTGAVESLLRVLSLGPDFLRIYPAVVLAGTELARLYRSGEYRPFSLDGAVAVCKEMLQLAAVAGVPVARVGLQADEGLATPGTVLAGPYHPALRQLAEGERWFDLLVRLCSRFADGESIDVFVPPARVADAVGQKRANLHRLRATLPVRIRRIGGDPSLGGGQVVVRGVTTTITTNLLEALSYHRSTAS